MTRKVTVYSKKPCGQCSMTKSTMNKQGVEYEEIRADLPGMEELAESIRGRAKELGVTGTMPYVTVHDEDNQLIADWFGFIPSNITDHAAVRDDDEADAA